MTTATFNPDTTTNYRNPERGWYFGGGTLDSSTSMDLPNYDADAAGQPIPLQNVTLASVRTFLGSGVPSGGTLAAWQTSFNLARSTGIMFILRFLSTGTAAQIIAQTQAIAPILALNEDVIAVVQVGFRGDFGEWAGGFFDNDNVADKTAIFNAIVAMTPTTIPLDFTHIYERETWFGNKNPVSATERFTGSVKARLGAHSDCFLTENGDSSFYTYVGTLTGFQSTMTAAQQAAYIQACSEYTSFGGEICIDSQGAALGMRTAPIGGVDAQGLPGGILNEAPRYHLSYLGGGQVGSGNFFPAWFNGGALNTIANMMGYRFQYDQITHVATAARGTMAVFDVLMRNYGWARMHKRRHLHLQLDNGGTRLDFPSLMQMRELPSQATGSTLVRVYAPIPAGTPAGTYAVSLRLSSEYSTTQGARFTPQNANANNVGAGQLWDSTNSRWTTGTSIALT